MQKSARPFILIIFLIVIPLLIYTFLQVRSLNEDEKMAYAIYEKQMETVLFSLNQYADDQMSRWVGKLSGDDATIHKNATNLVLGNESIQLLSIREMATATNNLYLNEYVQSDQDITPNLENWYAEEDSVLRRLSRYLNAGFQKIHPAEGWKSLNGLQGNQIGITSMFFDVDSALYNALFILQSTYWVEQILGPKMQEISQEELRLGVYHWPKSQQQPTFLYQTDSFNTKKQMIKKKLWVLKDTYLTIQPQGESYADIIRERSQNNMYFLFFAILVVLIGAILVLRNIRITLKMAQLKSDFVSNVSHEIRTPLALIRMYAETLMLDRLPSEEKKRHYYEVIHHESGRLTYLVNNILDFSRIEANKKTYRLERKELNELVEGIYSGYTHFFKENNFKTDLSLAENALFVSVDSQAFEEALSNLIENAIKYSGDKKEIEISTYLEDKYVCCAVKDHGIGISRHAQQNIFEKFYRVEGALTQKTKGTGLGLSLVKHIMDAHQGQVIVNSKPGEGSTFILKFPTKVII